MQNQYTKQAQSALRYAKVMARKIKASLRRH